MQSPPIYLDNHATTPLDPRVLEAMMPYLTERFGNAASRHHSYGWQAEQGVDRARQQVATLLGVRPREIVFTSGATESINLAIKGILDAAPVERKSIVLPVTEHKAVLDTCSRLEHQGVKIFRIGVDSEGFLDQDQLARVLPSRPGLLCVLHANNEIGTIQPLQEICGMASRWDVPVHLDIAQSAGKIPLDLGNVGASLASLSGHKIYGPKGVGALWVRHGIELTPQIDGGGHERGLRSGTLNVPGIVGLGAACDLARLLLVEESERIAGWRDSLLGSLTSNLDGIRVNGPLGHGRLPNNLNLRFEGVDAASLMTAMPGIAMSTGSACTSADPKPSHVLEAIGLERAESLASLRIGLGRFNTPQELEQAAGMFQEAVQNLRELSPVYGL